MKSKKVVFSFIIGVLFSIFLFFPQNNVRAVSSQKPLDDGVYVIKSAIDESYVLDISAASQADGANLQIWSNADVSQQKFELKYENNGYYIIINQNSKKLVDVAGGGKASGTNVQQYTSNNTDAQKWELKDAGDGYFYIVSKGSGLYLDVSGGIAKDGSNVQIYEGNETKAQKFKFDIIERKEQTPNNNSNKPDNSNDGKTVENGTYTIKSAIDESFVLDVSAASKADGANLQVWRNADVVQQKFELKYNGDGFYVINNKNSGKAVDVAGGGKVSGTNVQQYSSNNTDAQKWQLKDAGDGYYYLIAKGSGLYLDVSGGVAKDGSNVQIYEGNKTKAQKFKIDSSDNLASSSNPVEQPASVTEQPGNVVEEKNSLKSGIYSIKSGLNDKYVLDVSAASRKNGANIQLWTNQSAPQQYYSVEKVNDEYYSIININSKKSIDINGGNKAVGTNIQQYQPNATDAQKWVLKDAGEGYYYIVSKDTDLCLDVQEGEAIDGANINLNKEKSLQSQKFYFSEFSDNINQLGENEKTIEDGTYILKTALNEDYVLDISAGSSSDRANLQLWKNAFVIQQRFRFRYIGNGYYNIINANSGKALEVENGNSGANVYQNSINDSDAQKWAVKRAENGYYYILSKTSGRYLDIANSEENNGQNVQIYDGFKIEAQKFKLEQTGYRAIEDGIYFIKSAVDQNYVLDISAASTENGANVQIWSNAQVTQQKFRVKYNDSGYYTIKSLKSQKVLDVAGGSTNAGSNVQQYASNGTDAQKWFIEDTADGYNIVSKLTGYRLNLASNNVYQGTNVNVEHNNYSRTQRFYFEKTNTSIDIDTKRYPGYKEKIENLMNKYSNWDFELLYIGRTLDNDVDKEAELITRNLMPNTSSSEWILNDSPQDTGSWVPASKYAIRYYMDPRNFLDEINIFQFKDVNQYNEDACTENGIRNRVSGSYLNDYINDIINACRNTNVDPYYVIARLIQEQGWNGGSTWRMNGDRGTVYNPFNIGASGNSRSEVIDNAYNRAANSGWYTMQSAIEGGISFLKMNYLENYQNTLYTNKFDINPRKSRNYTHQYMQNTMAAYSEARNLRSFYYSDNKLNSEFTFVIPVFEGL